MIVDSIVYAMDYSFGKIWAFTLHGVFIKSLDLAIGSYGSPYQLAIRPGTFPPLSLIITEFSDLTYNAGELIKFPLELRDDRNKAISTSYPDPNRFTVFATSSVEVNGEMRELRFPSKWSRTRTKSFL